MDYWLQRYLTLLRARLWDQRYVAVHYLTPYAADPVVQLAIEPLLSDIDYRVRRETVRVLARQVIAPRVRAAFQLLQNDGDPEIRRLVAAALDQCDNSKQREAGLAHNCEAATGAFFD